MLKFLIPVLSAGIALCVVSSANASIGDAKRMERFAQRARVSGAVSLDLHYAGDPDRCAAAQTCGLSGVVKARIRFDPRRRITVRDHALVLPVLGNVGAATRDETAQRNCTGTAKLRSAGMTYRGDDRGLLLRPLYTPDASGIEDPFDTACRAPRLADLGRAALPSLRLRSVARNVSRMSLELGAERDVRAGGFTATVTTSGRISLRRPR